MFPMYREHDRGAHHGLPDLLNDAKVRKLGRALNPRDAAVGLQYLEDDVGGRLDDVHPALALQALLDHLHVEQAQKATAKAKAKGSARFGHVSEGGVVEAELVERLPQPLKIGVVGRIKPTKDHRQRLLVARELVDRGA